jgi:hypothetical protein
VKATQDNNGNVTVNVQENMRNPLTPIGGGIQENVNIMVNQNATTAEFKGQVSGSPAFEGNVTVDGWPDTKCASAGRSHERRFIWAWSAKNQ